MRAETQSPPSNHNASASLRPARRLSSPLAIRSAGRIAALSCLLALAGLGPATADWLVTTDGQRVETEGAWEVRGRLVVYTTPDGDLTSVRASQIDIEASQQATEEAKRPAAEPERRVAEAQEPAEPVLVLNDTDVARVAPGGTVEPPGQSGRPRQVEEQVGAGGELQVVSHSSSFNAEENRLEVTGQLENGGRSLITRFFLTVVAYDEGGSVVGQTEASFDEEVLRPGESTRFEAHFEGLTRAGDVRFKVASSGFKTQQQPEPEKSEP